jgi:glycosyltransferase involved in cell wall biosynthesis
MRVGQNPVKAIERIAPPALVTAVVINYIPFLSGYYAHSLDLLKLCLGSLRKTTKDEADLMVFDNGSCVEVRDFLLGEQLADNIHYLTLSERNLGKPAAWNFAFAAAPGEFVAYVDSDVFFYDGWLQASLDAFMAFPQVGMITAMPILTPQKYSTATLKWAKKQRGVKVERGQLLPWEDFWRHARSLGDTEEDARRFYAENPMVRLSFKGKRYYAGAAHFQFTARKSVLQEVLPIPADRPMGRVRLLDEAINAEGYLRLSTEKWYVQHLGNQVPAATDFVHESPLRTSASKRLPTSAGIWRWSPLRKLLQWLNGWSFDRLHRGPR